MTNNNPQSPKPAAREFFIDTDRPSGNFIAMKDKPNHPHYIHVIEKSAYDYAVDQWDYFVEEKTKWQTKAEALERELAHAEDCLSYERDAKDVYLRNAIALEEQLAEANKSTAVVRLRELNVLFGRVDKENKWLKVRIAELEDILTRGLNIVLVHAIGFSEWISEAKKALKDAEKIWE